MRIRPRQSSVTFVGPVMLRAKPDLAFADRAATDIDYLRGRTSRQDLSMLSRTLREAITGRGRC